MLPWLRCFCTRRWCGEGGVQNKDPLEVVREEVEVQVERFWGKETNLASITVATRCNFTTNLFKFNP